MNIQFIKPYWYEEDKEDIVDVDVVKLDKDWQKDIFYVGKNGDGANPEKIEKLLKAISEKNPCMLEMSYVAFSHVTTLKYGRKYHIGFIDGRHRFSILRDMGIKVVPVIVPKHQKHLFEEKYNYDKNIKHS